MGDRRLGPKGTSMIQVSPGNFVPVSNFAGSITATAPKGGIGGGTTLPASVNMGGMGGVGDSGGDAGGDAVTLADILNLPKVLTDEEKFQKAEEELAAAAERLADFQAMKGSAYGLGTTEEGDQADQYFTKQAELQAELEQARENYIALGGDPNPSFLSKVGQAGLDLIGGTGQVLSDIATLGTGPEVAQTLVDPVSILLGGLGGTINYAESGKTTPLILGQTSSGMPVGLNIPDPRSVLEGGLTTLIPGAAAAASTAGALSVSGNEEGQDQIKSGVGVTPAGALTAAAATDDDDTTKTTTTTTTTTDDLANIVGSTDPLVGGLTTEQAEAIGAAEVNDTTKTTTSGGDGTITFDDLGDAIGPVQEITFGDLGDAIGPTQEPDEIKFTMGSPQYETTTTKTGPTLATTLGQDQSQVKTTPADLMASLASDEEKIVTPAELAAILGSESTETIRTSTAPTLTTALGGGSSSSGSSGGFSLPTSGGMRSVSGGPGPTVDLDYLYDFYGDLTQPFQATEDEEDIVKAAEGGMIGNTDDFERILRLLRGA